MAGFDNCFVQTCDQQITGRNFAYDRALRVIEDEEYLDDIDFVRAITFFHKSLIYEFFHEIFFGFFKGLQKVFFFNKWLISAFFVYFDINQKLLHQRKTKQRKICEKRFVDSGFVKTCDVLCRTRFVD